MKAVLALLGALSVVHYAAAAECNLLQTFNAIYKPACDPDDIYIKWPNYQDPSSYYVCNGVYQPMLTTCPTGQYFSFVYQFCGPCQNYIPPVRCEKLRTQYPPNCTPTANAPTTTSTTSTAASTTTTTTTTSATTPTPTPITTTPSTTTTTTSNTSTTTTPATTTAQSTTKPEIAMPPSPATEAPGVPNPPTPAPTPPSAEAAPPTPPVIS